MADNSSPYPGWQPPTNIPSTGVPSPGGSSQAGTIAGAGIGGMMGGPLVGGYLGKKYGSSFAGPGGALDELFGGGAQEAAQLEEQQLSQGQRALQSATGQGASYLQPYASSGYGAMQGLLAGTLPTSTTQGSAADIANLQSTFSQTPSQKFQQKQAMDSINNAMQAQGLGGSGAQMQGISKTTGDVLGGQFQQYLQNVLGERQQSLQGLQAAAGMGTQAAGGLGQLYGKEGANLASLFGQMGQAEAAGAQGQAAGVRGMFTGGLF